MQWSGTRPRHAGILVALAVAVVGMLLPATAAADGKRVYRAQKSGLVQGRIVGGSRIPITAAPWQVTVTSLGRVLCGGSILDATRVVTAAHCVTDTTARPNVDLPPGSLTVQAGISKVNPVTLAADPQPGDALQTRAVTANSVHPYYPRALLGGGGTLNDFADDVAVLTLATPLNLSGPTAQPVPLTAPNVLSPVGAAGRVTGFGLQQETPPVLDGFLNGLGEIVQDAADPALAGPLNAIYAVGVAPAGSACSGDSGSALTVGGALLGIVSSGSFCAGLQATDYTNVSAAEIQAFINGNRAPPIAPRGGQDIVLVGPARAPQQGDKLSCSAGTWSAAPSFTYVFSDAATRRELQRGPSNVYTVTGTSDAGAAISCRVVAANAGGVGLTPRTQATPAVVAAPPPPSDRLSVTLTAAQGTRAAAVSLLQVRRGQTVTFTATVYNRGNRTETNVRRCIPLSSRYTVIRRGGGRITRGQICYTSTSLGVGRSVRRRFVVRIDRDAKLGRLVSRVRATSSQKASASARRDIVVLAARRRSTPRPPFVTG